MRQTGGPTGSLAEDQAGGVTSDRKSEHLDDRVVL